MDIPRKKALVLTGGGARGAYQAGALMGIAEICKSSGIDWPFSIVTGTSAGAINACFISSRIVDKTFLNCAQDLVDLWKNISSYQVYRADSLALFANGLKWIRVLSLAGKGGQKEALSLLDASPLKNLLRRQINMDMIDHALEQKRIDALAINAVSYANGESVTFFQDRGQIKPWDRMKRRGQRDKITHSHIMASAAIPILFSPVGLGAEYFGDGSLRDYTPLSGPIHLGAKKLLVIGVKKRQRLPPKMERTPTLGKVMSTIISGLLLDALDFDFERLTRINSTLSLIPDGGAGDLSKVDVTLLTPSQDLAVVARKHFQDLPQMVRYFVTGLGRPEDVADLISYVLFERSFTQELIDIGHHDALVKKDDIIQLLAD
jgi:NTE family protein